MYGVVSKYNDLIDIVLIKITKNKDVICTEQMLIM
jgi:hypothetical protein